MQDITGGHINIQVRADKQVVWVNDAIKCLLRACQLESVTIDNESSETTASISDWAEATFGPVGSNISVLRRALKEVTELKHALATGDTTAALDELADTVIILHRLAARLGGDLNQAIDAKMAINRARRWTLDGTGHGQHIDE